MSIQDYQGNPIYVHFISIKDFGAVGDGVTDDASAIQDALDSARQTGGIIFFPIGTYLLTEALIFYANQTLWFESGAVLKQGAAINNLLRTYCESSYTGYSGVHDCLIYGATFDGGTYEQNNTLVGIGHAKNIAFENCVFKNAYGEWHDLEINSSYNVKVINCDFEGSRKTAQNAEMLQIDAALSTAVYPWSGFAVDNTVSKYIDISGCIFHDDTVSPAIGCHADAAHNFIRIHDCIFDGLTGSTGAIKFTSSPVNIDIFDNTFNGCTKGIGSSAASYYIHDNRFVDATTAISGAGVSHNNMINGTYTA